ncbi:alpha/beta fold hydrolase [Streptomyces lavenduligriseus]|uniref:Alpha/beta hydrolase n=1 Tax=Streptomyces lavenduligriseus TaxID=67315 RepID=A0ABT0NR75_9ACTN|nr:alpha/beta fold hydrolase [Streptomyces lavenduligriseus]MCL3993803.1 alpha/beta hydrolase [Streptomyces lavenduligriseus]
MAYTTVDNITLHYEDLGAGRPLVFLHGWGTSGRVWDAQAAGLMADHRVITLDWRGCGRSGRPADGYTISRLAGDVLEFVDALELDRPVMIGSSIAGAFIIEAALAAPDRFRAIIPVDAGVHHFSGLQSATDKLLANLRADRAGTLADFVPHWYRPGASTAMIDWTVAQLLESTFRIDGLLADQARYDPRERVAALRVPTHFLHGELDTEVPLSVPRELAALIPGSRLTVIDGAGHMAQQDQADRFTAALRAALSGLL